MKHKIVIVFTKNRGPSSTRFGGFIKRLKKAGHFLGDELICVALEDIVFDISSKDVALTVEGIDPFVDTDFVYFKSWESMPEQASALAALLKIRGIPYADQVVGGFGVSKLPMMIRFVAAGLPVPHTLYGFKLSSSEIESKLGLPVIVKAVHGQKGQDNYLFESNNDLADFISSNDMSKYIAQEFIPNDGDLRIWVYGGKVRGGLIRKRTSGHLNNVSSGAEASHLSIEDINPEVEKMARKAASACLLNISGVDVVCSMESGKWYVLEANQGSQIVTGANLEQKMAAFHDGINSLLEKRYRRQKTPMYKMDIVGRHASVDFPEWGINGMIAKVDTGAYQAALHAENIREEDGQLTFTITRFEHKDGSVSEPIEVKTTNYSFAEVRNTSGKLEKRYLVPVKIFMKGRRFNTKVTLTNRGTMKYPLLIGRRTLRGRFLVNAELSRKTSL